MKASMNSVDIERLTIAPRSNNWNMVQMAYESLTSREKTDFLREKLGQENKAPEKILRRAEVANRLSVSLRTVDKLAEQGVITKVKLPYRKRAMGFQQSESDRLVGSGVAS